MQSIKVGDTVNIKIDGVLKTAKVAAIETKMAAIHMINERGTLDRAQLVFVARLSKKEG